ncbi:hypothetical protein [Sabulicella glaciei]|uniref:Uncharacterized protein n=1 Tax=Sabulicella glaciei TaxID=2984948 RepID=A0ABT3P1K2_9PROT|nr:hypothetical protein [Roseococcus sp. MDT2-1-1]MCW8088282.1 hypothetical protein [Roseococcus sp. MDT2-1-1]
MRAFRFAARGCGAVPWVLDYDQIEQELVALLLQQPPERRSVGLEGSKMLAREFRDWIRDGTDLVHSAVGVRTDCPFDLHSLVPIPWPVLQLGPDDPKAIRWMWENWGTTWTLRRVEEVPLVKEERKTLPPGQFLARYRFWSADWSPWQAIKKLRQEWPALRFRLSFQVEWPELRQDAGPVKRKAAASLEPPAAPGWKAA